MRLTIIRNLKWNQHANNIVRKANKQINFIIKLKRAVPVFDLLLTVVLTFFIMHYLSNLVML